MHLIILSNSPATSFLDNTSANFTVPLNIPLRTPFGEKWKVALLQVLVPNAFYNVELDESIKIEYEDGEKTVFRPKEGVFIRQGKLVKHLIHNDFNFKWENGFELEMSDKVKILIITNK